MQNTLTLGDVIGLLIKRADVPWETLPPRAPLGLRHQPPDAAPERRLHLQGPGSGPGATVKVTCRPASTSTRARPSCRSAATRPPLGDPTSSHGEHAHLDASRRPFGIAVAPSPSTSRSGTDVGPTQATETVTRAASPQSSIGAVLRHRQLRAERHGAHGRRRSRRTRTSQMSALATPGGRLLQDPDAGGRHALRCT